MAGFVGGKDEVNHVFSLAVKAVEIELSCSLEVTRFALHEKTFFWLYFKLNPLLTHDCLLPGWLN